MSGWADWGTTLAVIAVLVLPLAAAATTSRGDRGGAAFLTNAGRNGGLATLAGAVAGNVGIGSFLAIFLFAGQSPLIGYSIVGAYTLGLVLCAWLAPLIRARADERGTIGLVDLIATTHAGTRMGWIWMPVAVVFVLRSAVQIGAIGLIAGEALGVGRGTMIAVASALMGLYLVTGGYRAAVRTDMLQAAVLVVGMAAAATGLALAPVFVPSDATFGDLGPHEPAFLVAIWLLLPWSAVLAVDNWQRIVVARTGATARGAYLVAALACGAIFATIAVAGTGAAPGASVRDTFEALMPRGASWLASAMFVACIMSSVDTFIMPLVTSLGPVFPLRTLRVLIAALVAATAALAIAFGDTLANVIAAFNGLVVFLPAALGALLLTAPPRRGAVLSMNGGLVAAVTATMVNRDAGALTGFAVAVLLYLACLAAARREPAADRAGA